MATNHAPAYAHPGDEQDERATRHRQQALAALAEGRALDALVEAVLACESRLDEMMARAG